MNMRVANISPNREYKIKFIRYIILTILLVAGIIFLFRLIFSSTL